jgi:hypothetical protein
MWRRDSRELYFLAKDGTVMAAPIRENPANAAEPIALFKSPIRVVSEYTEQYAASSDGQRFLFAPYVNGETKTKVTVLTNWQARLAAR